jgi:hypothetical protein
MILILINYVRNYLNFRIIIFLPGDLATKVGHLKRVTIAIGDEVGFYWACSFGNII